MKYTILSIVELAISLEEESTFDFLYNKMDSVAGVVECMLQYQFTQERYNQAYKILNTLEKYIQNYSQKFNY